MSATPRSSADADLEDMNMPAKTITANNFNAAISPNPTSGIFTLQLKEQMQGEVFIYNELGQVVYQSAISNLQTAINISTQPKGIYFVRVYTVGNLSNGVQTAEKVYPVGNFSYRVYTEKVVVQ